MKTPYAIDTHCHLTLAPKKEQNALVERAQKANVQKMISVSCTLEQIGEGLALADQHNCVWTTAGIHPTDLTDNAERDLARVYQYAKNEKTIVAIGEIGLDYYHDKFAHGLQATFLSGQLDIAKQTGKPAILHCRAGKGAGENDAAFVDLFHLLREARFTDAVMHCFSGTLKQAEEALEMGLMLSFTGIVTYDRNKSLRDILKHIPLERIMIETDSPFLPPENHKGESNEPAFVIEVAKTIAEVKELPFDEVLRVTSGNAERFFNI